MLNLVSVEEEQVIGGKLYNEESGYFFIDGPTVVKCFKFSKKAKITP